MRFIAFPVAEFQYSVHTLKIDAMRTLSLRLSRSQRAIDWRQTAQTMHSGCLT